MITLCPFQGCGFRCCEFNQGNYIVLYPGELEAARQAGYHSSHLQNVEPYHGGHRAVCRARDTSCCDGGYKPLDCRSYPFFPTMARESGRVTIGLKGAKCPLTAQLIPEHRAWVATIWNRLIARRPEVAEWLRHVRLVGYDPLRLPNDNRLEDEAMPLEELSISGNDSAAAKLFTIQERYLGVRPRVAAVNELDFIHRELIRLHPIVVNQLYQRLVDGRMDNAAYQLFFSEYTHGSQKSFYEVVLPRAREAHDHPRWQVYIEHIVEEESTPAPHWKLFADFAADCGCKLGPPEATARRYGEAILRGYLADLPFAAGYALALEVQAGYEIAVLYEALKRCFPAQLARTGWFDAHLAEGQEEEHSKASVELVASVAETPDALARAREGFLQYCDNALVFMESVNRQIVERELAIAAE